MTRKTRKGPAGWIYFVSCPKEGLIKIGFATDPRRRWQQIRTINAVPIEPMAVMEGTIPEERALHERFRSDWSHGEWFRASPDLVAYIVANAKRWDSEGGVKRRKPVALPPKETVQQWAERTPLAVNGETRTVSEWAAIKGVTPFCIKCNMKAGTPFTDLFWSSARGLREIKERERRRRMRGL